jgi:RNA polymerase sigma factor (sigma-70 family)
VRLSDDPDLAADLAQEAFVRLYQRGRMPECPEAWIITVATNLFRNERAKGGRRKARLTRSRAAEVHSDPPASPSEHASWSETRADVRRALDRLTLRERQLLLLRAEGYAYRDIASALALHEASVGKLLARARGAFKAAFEETVHAP